MNKQTKNNQTKPNKKKHINTEDKIVVTKGEGVKERVKRVKGINLYGDR